MPCDMHCRSNRGHWVRCQQLLGMLDLLVGCIGEIPRMSDRSLFLRLLVTVLTILALVRRIPVIVGIH